MDKKYHVLIRFFLSNFSVNYYISNVFMNPMILRVSIFHLQKFKPINIDDEAAAWKLKAVFKAMHIRQSSIDL